MSIAGFIRLRQLQSRMEQSWRPMNRCKEPRFTAKNYWAMLALLGFCVVPWIVLNLVERVFR